MVKPKILTYFNHPQVITMFMVWINYPIMLQAVIPPARLPGFLVRPAAAWWSPWATWSVAVAFLVSGSMCNMEMSGYGSKDVKTWKPDMTEWKYHEISIQVFLKEISPRVGQYLLWYLKKKKHIQDLWIEKCVELWSTSLGSGITCPILLASLIFETGCLHIQWTSLWLWL